MIGDRRPHVELFIRYNRVAKDLGFQGCVSLITELMNDWPSMSVVSLEYELDEYIEVSLGAGSAMAASLLRNLRNEAAELKVAEDSAAEKAGAS